MRILQIMYMWLYAFQICTKEPIQHSITTDWRIVTSGLHSKLSIIWNIELNINLQMKYSIRNYHMYSKLTQCDMSYDVFFMLVFLTSTCFSKHITTSGYVGIHIHNITHLMKHVLFLISSILCSSSYSPTHFTCKPNLKQKSRLLENRSPSQRK